MVPTIFNLFEGWFHILKAKFKTSDEKFVSLREDWLCFCQPTVL